MAWESDPWYSEASFKELETSQFGPLIWRDEQIGPRLAWGLQDDAEALLYYGSFGLLDPKMPFEAFTIRRALGLVGVRGLLIGAGMSMSGGVTIAAVLGWAFDPMHKREGGFDDWNWSAAFDAAGDWG